MATTKPFEINNTYSNTFIRRAYIKHEKHHSKMIPFEENVLLTKGFQAQSGIKLNPIKAQEFVETALKTDIIYHKNRKALWALFTEAMDNKAPLKLSKEAYNTIAGTLQCRNNNLSDDKQLAFNVVVQDMNETVQAFLEKKEKSTLSSKMESQSGTSFAVQKAMLLNKQHRLERVSHMRAQSGGDEDDQSFVSTLVCDYLPAVIMQAQGYLEIKYVTLDENAMPERAFCKLLDKFFHEECGCPECSQEHADEARWQAQSGKGKAIPQEHQYTMLQQNINLIVATFDQPATTKQILKKLRKYAIQATKKEVNKILYTWLSDPVTYPPIRRKLLFGKAHWYFPERHISDSEGEYDEETGETFKSKWRAQSGNSFDPFDSEKIFKKDKKKREKLNKKPSTSFLGRMTEKAAEPILDKMETAVEGIKEQAHVAAVQMGALGEQVSDALKELADKMDKIKVDVQVGPNEQIGELLTSLKKAVQTYLPPDVSNEKVLEKIETVLGLLSLIYSFCRATQKDVKAAIVIAGLAFTHTASTAMSYYNELFLFIDVVKGWLALAQPAGEISDEALRHTENAFVSMVPVFWHMFGKTDSITAKTDEIRTKRFRMYLTTLKDSKDIFKFIWNVSFEAFKYIYEFIYQVPYGIDQTLLTLRKDVKIWVEQATKVLQRDIHFEASKDYEVANKVRDLVAEGDIYARALAEVPTLTSSFNFFYEILRGLKVLHHSLDSQRRACNSRQVPVCIHLFGPPGGGKSVLIRLLSKFFVEATNRIFTERSIYFRDLETEYWDNYLNQMVVAIDDCWQKDDKEFRTRVAMEIIKAVNDASYPLHMSNVNDKAGTFFTSELLILTSNLPAIPRGGQKDGLALQDMNALLRRFHLQYYVTNKATLKKYADVALDNKEIVCVSQYDTAVTESSINEYVFFRTDPMSTKIDTSVQYNFKDVCKQLLQTRERVSGIKHGTIMKQLTTDKDLFRKMGIAQCRGDKTKWQECEKAPTREWAQKKWNVIGGEGTIPEDVYATTCLAKCPEFDRSPPKSEPEDELPLMELHIDKTNVSKFRMWFDKKAKQADEALTTFHMRVVKAAREHPKTAIGVLLASAGLIGVALGTLAYIKYRTDDEEEVEAQSYPGRFTLKTPPAPNLRSFRKKQQQVNLDVMETQSGTRDVMPILRNVIKPNLYHLLVEDDRGRIKNELILFIAGKIGITAAHMIKYAWQKDSITLINCKGEKEVVNARDMKVQIDNKRDLAFITIMKPQFRIHKNITHHFITEEDLNLVIGPSLIGVSMYDSDLETRVGLNPKYVGEMTYSFKMGANDVSCSDSFTMRGHSVQGDCGGPYIIPNSAFVHTIAGIHIAGAPGVMAGCLVTQQYLKDALKDALTAQSGYTVTKLGEGEKKEAFEIPQMQYDNVTILGTVTPARTMPTRSKIVKSPFYGEFGPIEEVPAVFTAKVNPDGELVDPLPKSLKLFDRPVNNNADPALLKKIAKKIPTMIKTTFEPRKLTWEEALNGVKGATYLRKVEPSTSSGYPENMLPGAKGKRHLINEDEQGNLSYTPELLEKCKQAEKELIEGKRPDLVYCDNYKDERLPWRKVYDKATKKWIIDTRVMSSANIVLLILMRRYFGAMMENIMLDHLEGIASLGVNPHSHEWGLLKKRLSKFGEKRNLFAGDVKKLDKTYPFSVAEPVWDGYNEWYRLNDLEYRPADGTVRKGLLLLNHKAVHVLANVIFQVQFGNPSGQYLTTVDNCFGMFVVMVYCFEQILREEGFNFTIDEVISMVEAAYFGDDHVVAADDPITENITVPQLAQKMLDDFGLTYTSIDKVSELRLYDWEEVSYLSRSWKDTWFAPLEWSTIKGSLNYQRKSSKVTAQSITDSVHRSALFEAFHHGKQQFEEFKNELNEKRVEKGMDPIEISYTEIYEAWEDPNATQANFYAQSGEQPKETVNRQEQQTVTNPTATQSTITVTFGDNVGKETANPFEDAQIKSPATDPYPDQGLKQVLERNYIVKNISWSGADAQGALIDTLTFPKLLWDIPNIKEKLDRFQFFRAKCLITFRINTTGMHFGALQLSWIPHYRKGGNLNYQQNIYTASNLCSTEVSANTNTTAEIEIPVVFPSRYWNMKDSPDTGAAAEGFFGAVFVHVLAPLRLNGDGTTPSVSVTVNANFKDAEPAGFGLRDIAATDKMKNMIFKAQSGEQDIKSELKSQAKKYTKKAQDKATQIVADGSSMALDMISKTLGTFLGALADKPTDISAPTKVRIESNTGLATADGLDEVEQTGMDPQNKVSNDHHIYSDPVDYNLFSNYKLLPSLIKLGSFTASDLQGYKFLTIPVSPLVVAHDADVNYNYFYNTHIANLALFFYYWTGSLKYHLKLYSSKYTSCRVSVKWLPDPTYTGALANSDFGDTVSHVIDVCGDTDFSFTIPWLRERSWEEVGNLLKMNDPAITDWLGFNGQLVFQIVNALTNYDAESESVVYYALWISGGEDFRVARPTHLSLSYSDATTAPSFTAQSGNGVTLTHNKRELFQRPFPTLVPTKILIQKDITMGEEVSSWPQLAKRYTKYEEANETGQPLYEIQHQFYKPTIGDTTFFSRINRTFHFRRGSVRHKIYVMPLTTQAMELLGQNLVNGEVNSYSGEQGVVIVDTRQRQFLEFQTPFYFDYDMVASTEYLYEQKNLPYALLLIKNTTGAASQDLVYQWWVSVGDDWTFGWPSQPVPLKIEIAKKTSNKNTKK